MTSELHDRGVAARRLVRRTSLRRLLLAAVTATLGLPAAAPAAVYYVAPGGNDAMPGRTAAMGWGTLDKVATASLAPGDQVLLRRGGTWSGALNLTQSGTAAAPITIGAYGAGPAPVISGGDCINLNGAYQVVTGMDIRNCTKWGVRLAGTHGTVDGNVISHNVVGVEVADASSQNRITRNQLIDNNRLNTDPGSGAFGVLLNGSDNYVAGNLIQGSDTASPVYGRDGSAVEVYGGKRNLITQNLAVDNLTFTELGNPASADNTFSYNVIRSKLPTSSFLVTRGSGSYGPVRNTRVLNNTVHMTGSQAEGFICSGCGTDILYMRNNIISAPHKAGYAGGPVDEDYDLFAGAGIRQFNTGAHSFVGDPKWANPGAGDYHLLPGSPALDRGVNLGSQVDFAGTRVPYGNAPDLGAFEFAPPGATAPRPAPLAVGLVVAERLRRSRFIARGLAVRCAATRPARCGLLLALSASDARRLHLDVPAGRRLVVARRAVSVGTAAKLVRLRPSRALAARLRRAPRIRVTLRLSVVVVGGGNAIRVIRAARLLPG